MGVIYLTSIVINCLYSEAFLLERLGRTQEAVKAWQRILQWHHEHNWIGSHETDLPQEHLDNLLSKQS